MRTILFLFTAILFSTVVRGQERNADVIQIYEGLKKATSIYVTQNHVYVVESGRNRILKLDHSGKLIETMGGLGSGDYQLDTPLDIDATNGLKIYISDYRNGRIQIFDRRSQFLSSIYTIPQSGERRNFQPGQLVVTDFGELTFYDESTKYFYRFNENGAFSGSFRLPSKVSSVSDLQSGGRMLYIFDKKKKQYHLMTDNGLHMQSYPLENAQSFFVDDKGREWAFTMSNMFDLRSPENPVYWDYEINPVDVDGINDTFFLLAPNEIYKIELSQQ